MTTVAVNCCDSVREAHSGEEDVSLWWNSAASGEILGEQHRGTGSVAFCLAALLPAMAFAPAFAADNNQVLKAPHLPVLINEVLMLCSPQALCRTPG